MSPNSGQQGQQNLLVTITGRFTETVIAPFAATFTGDLTGTVVSAVVLEGDCVTTPLTRARSVIAVAVTT